MFDVCVCMCFQANVRNYYQQFEEQQTQSLIDQRIKEHLGQAAAFQQVGVAYNHLMVPRPGGPPLLPMPQPRFPMPGNVQMPGGQPLMPGMRPLMPLPRPVPGAPGEYICADSFPDLYKLPSLLIEAFNLAWDVFMFSVSHLETSCFLSNLKKTIRSVMVYVYGAKCLDVTQ